MTWARTARRLRRRAMAHHRLVSALLVGLAVLVGLGAVAPSAGPTVAVLVAARDLGVGTPLAAGDVASRAVPAPYVPDGALPAGEAVVGRLLAGPVRRGETLTDARLVGPSLLARSGLGRGVVATPVRLADPGAAALLRPGDRVDVYAVPAAGFGVGALGAGGLGAGEPGPGGAGSDPGAPDGPDRARAGAPAEQGSARLVASDLLVLTVPAPDPMRAGPEGALVVFAATPPVARVLAHAAATGALSVALRAPP